MRVLVLEDDVIIAMDLDGMLAELGHEVVGPFRTVAAALSAIEGGTAIDHGLLDHSLGPHSSTPVALALQDLGIPFTAVTGHHRDNLPAELAAAPHLLKPVSRAALAAILDA